MPVITWNSATKPLKPGIPMEAMPPMIKLTATKGILRTRPPNSGICLVWARR